MQAFDWVSWQEILTRARQCYLLGFYAPPELPAGQLRRLEIRLSSEARRRCAGCVVRARSWYRVR